jgi:enediyne biosynthesis protein E4
MMAQAGFSHTTLGVSWRRMQSMVRLLVGLALSAPAFAGPLAWEQGEGYRAAKLTVGAAEGGRTPAERRPYQERPERTSTERRPYLTLLTPQQTGIYFTNQLSYERSQANQNLLNGSGVAAGDFDGDGFVDLYFCNLEGANALFRNNGDWTFENVTGASGTSCTNQTSRGAVWADIDGDGNVDLLVSSLGGPNACLRNEGKGRFVDVTEAAGLALKAGCHSMALGDVDGDGDLDLYVANNGENSILRSGGAISVRTVNGKPVVTGRHGQRVKIVDGQLIELGEPDAFYLNDGKGRFERLSWTGGRFLDEEGAPLKSAFWDQGLSVMFRDMDGDSDPDIYVCNDFQTPDRIWMNDGQGGFRLIAPNAIRSTCHFSMGVDFADIDRDGDDDFFVSDMLSRNHRLLMRQIGATNPPAHHVGEKNDRHQVRRNTLQLNRGDGTYADIANYAGVEASDWTWTVLFLDVDLDGYEDLLVANGHAYDTQDLDMLERSPARSSAEMRGGGKNLKDFPPLQTPNYAFRNRGDLTFEEMGAKWGFNSTQISHGISLADLDNDGDLDVAVSCLWKAPLIYRNESTAPRVAVRLRGKVPNTQGVGAKIKVTGGAVPAQTQEVISGGRYLSGDDTMRVFAAGTLTNHLSIEVTWRSGRRSVVPEALPNHIYEIDEGVSVGGGAPTLPSATSASSPAAAVTFQSGTAAALPLFKDVSDLVAHTHQEPWFNDFDRQPLLHRQLSEAGPAVAWCDVDGDGSEELVIGAARGGKPALYRRAGNGTFARTDLPEVSDDVAGIAAWNSALAALSGLETEGGDALRLFGKETMTVARPEQWNGGPVATADVDGDGDLDVFAGGRALPGRYPEPAPSVLFRNDAGQLTREVSWSEGLRSAGLVNGAVFSDLDRDGNAELVMACEWGPLRVFKFNGGKVVEATAELGLDKATGWWQSVTTGDFDGDGRMDIVAGNWGLNSSYGRPTAERPVSLYYGDFDANGSVDLLEAYVDAQTGKIAQRRDMALLGTGLPLLRTRFKSHAAYSEADFATVLGARPEQVAQARATTLATVVLLNRTNRFVSVPLPTEAQFAPVFGLNVADMNGDGADDIFLAQNFFVMRPEEPRLDAGRGLWLRNDGKGNFKAVPGHESGVTIYGEQRGSAVADFDGDGRVDLAVGQNDGVVKLYRNERAKPGLRVRLQGPTANPSGIGATVWLSFGRGNGPAREVRGGSGYGSQDSVVPVMGMPEAPTAVNVRWPGGKVASKPVPAEANSITIKPEAAAASNQ